MEILNLTQHKATAEQVAAGVVDLPTTAAEELKELLTFDDLPGRVEIIRRACAIARLAAEHGATKAMIGGAPFLMSALEEALIYRGIVPLYAFSRRDVVESVQEDGSVKKTAVFKHLGFVLA